MLVVGLGRVVSVSPVRDVISRGSVVKSIFRCIFNKSSARIILNCLWEILGFADLKITKQLNNAAFNMRRKSFFIPNLVFRTF